MKIDVEAGLCARLVVTRPVIIITTLHASGVVNAGVFGAYTNFSPSGIALAVWKGSHTHANMRRAREFVINVPPAELAGKLAAIAADVPETRSELDDAGLTAEPSRHVAPPGVAECVASVEMRLTQEVDAGDHALMLGEALGGRVEQSVWSGGRLDVLKARVFHSVAYPDPLYAVFARVFRAE